MHIDTEPKLSIQYWERAIESNPFHSKADDWQKFISQEHMKIRTDRYGYSKAWKTVQKESYQSEKHLALGRLQLKEDPMEAYNHFKEVRNDKYLERAKTTELGQQLARWQLAYQQVSQKKNMKKKQQ